MDEQSFRTGVAPVASWMGIYPATVAGDLATAGNLATVAGDLAAATGVLTTAAGDLAAAGVLAAQPLYNSQPVGAPLYNQDELIHASYPDLLGGFSSPFAIPDATTVTFPLVPYAGATPGDFDVAGFESVVINPFRKKQLFPSANSMKWPRGFGAVGGTKQAATPQGLIATVNTDDGSWSELLLARNIETSQSLKFTSIGSILFNAFQTNQQFLVITNNTNLGTLTSTLDPNAPIVGPAFYNQIKIEDWPFNINTGLQSQFGEYTNVLIFKFCEGTLEDRVKNPQKWTQAKDFNSPGSDPDAAQLELTAISQWIQDYIADARQQLTANNNTFFKDFVALAGDPMWNGILALKADINLKTFPPEIQGLVGGIDISRLNAHHFGVRINPVSASQIDITNTSSMFGLINYFDRAYEQQLRDGKGPDTPVPAPTNVDYDFKVLKLQVLFENAAVKDFSSKAQLTMNKLFADTVIGVKDAQGNLSYNNTIVYNGTYQRQDALQPVYIFDQTGSNRFLFDSNVLTCVEIMKSQFNTLANQDGKGQQGKVRARFSFWGYLNFGIPNYKEGNDTIDLDLFSFGGTSEAPDAPQQGLNFSSLGIEMGFDVSTPTVRNFNFDVSHIAFDLKQSTPRKLGMYSNFALQLNGMVNGDKDKTPVSLSYLNVSTQLNNNLPEATWYGLDCTLNLGTPGALASAVGFTSSFLFCWAPGSRATDSNYNLMVGLKLPGAGGNAKLFSLQGVLKVGVGDLRLIYDHTQQSFLLKLIDIGIKFLGIAKIPPGVTISFYLFGNPASDASKFTLGWYAAYVKDPEKAALDEISETTISKL